ncbi:helix-turn-helix domain-containing protein [Streptomyces sp. NPDC048825]|uniref:helix-turn-helix domain-containing protein n=1 Tax=Streptomyces sp. NPDC048825 TaxID=3365592 RepID=UPI00372138E0
MQDEQTEQAAALNELRRSLHDGLARSPLDKTQLARRTGLSRTTVQLAFQDDASTPSARTVSALARALKLPEQEMLRLRRSAAAEAGPFVGGESGPGRPINQWDPHDLEVHPATSAPGGRHSGTMERRRLPGYVPRAHDRVLAEAVREAAEGSSRMVILVGTSSTGKTRACWEAVQPLTEKGWRLWHPFAPTRAEAALEDLHRVQPRTVVWMNDAQHYLGAPGAGEKIAAAVHSLLIRPDRQPVLVLGTLWPEFAETYTALPAPSSPDPHSRVRELLAGRTLTVPETFDEQAMSMAIALAEGGDRLLADTLTRARADGQVTQDLAGAPELLRRYERSTPAARAILEAAMDARRLDVGLRLPQGFLTDAAIDYLSDYDLAHLREDWAEAAFAELARPVHGKQAALRRATSRPQRRPPGSSAPTTTPLPAAVPLFRLADYLEQHGRTIRRRTCPPASFWQAAHTHLDNPDDLLSLALAAEQRRRLEWGHHLLLRAAEAGGIYALSRLMDARQRTGDWEGAEALAQQAADIGDAGLLHALARAREAQGDCEAAEALFRKALDAGDTSALTSLAQLQERNGDRESAAALYQQAADAGHLHALYQLALVRDQTGESDAATALYQQAFDAGVTLAQWPLIRMREEAGDKAGAEALAKQAEHGYELFQLAEMREEAGDKAGAEALAKQAAEHGYTSLLHSLAEMRVDAGDEAGAEALTQHAEDHGYADVLYNLARSQERVGNPTDAEALYRRAVAAGETNALQRLASLRQQAGDLAAAEALYRKAHEAGDTSVLSSLAVLLEKNGGFAAAEALYRKAYDAGDTYALTSLVALRERAGDGEGAEALARRAADDGNTGPLMRLAWMRESEGDREASEALYRCATAAGDTGALKELAWSREEAGDKAGAETLAQQAADQGYTNVLHGLAAMRESAGQRASAEALARQVADAGGTFIILSKADLRRVMGDERFMPEHWWPYGLDPDGTTTSPWQ